MEAQSQFIISKSFVLRVKEFRRVTWQETLDSIVVRRCSRSEFFDFEGMDEHVEIHLQPRTAIVATLTANGAFSTPMPRRFRKLFPDLAVAWGSRRLRHDEFLKLLPQLRPFFVEMQWEFWTSWHRLQSPFPSPSSIHLFECRDERVRVIPTDVPFVPLLLQQLYTDALRQSIPLCASLVASSARSVALHLDATTPLSQLGLPVELQILVGTTLSIPPLAV